MLAHSNTCDLAAIPH